MAITLFGFLGSAFAADKTKEAVVQSAMRPPYFTFSGYVFGTYGSIPEDGSSFELGTEQLHIKVTKIREHRVEEAFLCVL